MLPKKHRIQRKDFESFFKKGKNHNAKSLMIRTFSLPQDQYTQCACVVSKKVSKCSPMRHLIRRRVYTILREYIPNLSPVAIIVVIKKGEDYSFQNLKKEIGGVMEKVKQ